MSDDKKVDDWINRVAESSGPRIRESKVFMSIVTEQALKDINPQMALELGLALLMDKPLVLVTDNEAKVPKSLARMAGLIQRIDMEDENSKAKGARALQEFIAQLPD